ncbi:tRNA pseudouridine synthase A, mitochondrial [Hypsibius exemplaris]|uniref:Pseudouridylate synthase 1 homolog n=1 Tax=Hypsibius exemplaris TaxID=2072580 RepID=A0A1W0WT36_HYPEX|nr:tRNA pseudouridine synthase A, mitochondrial [Hypsibius exemplaris]
MRLSFHRRLMKNIPTTAIIKIFPCLGTIYPLPKSSWSNAQSTCMMSSIADYLAKADADALAAEQKAKTAANSSEISIDKVEKAGSSIPKSYFKFNQGKPNWENRSKTGAETEHQKKKLKKVAILMGYSGQGYNGMQWNPDIETIESVLLAAMAKVELIPQDWQSDLQQLNFQRCARTDKGVSAAGQVVSLPIPVDSDIDSVVQRVNAELPPSIRLFGLRKVTRGFNSKNWCSARTYQYMMPTMAFAPLEDIVTYSYRMPVERVVQVNALLARFLGTNNFHNFTIGVKPWQDAAKRFMKEVTCGQPFVVDDIEFVLIKIKGQSFMMHQIRKMVGLIIAIMRGHVGPEIFDTVFAAGKVDIPRAPGLGLLLQSVHFDMYNDKFAGDGMHDALEWPECELVIEKFKEDFVYPVMVKGEKEDKSMLEWLTHLPNHIFGFREHEDNNNRRTQSELGVALMDVEKLREARQAASSSGEEDAGSDSESAPVKKKFRRVDVI